MFHSTTLSINLGNGDFQHSPKLYLSQNQAFLVFEIFKCFTLKKEGFGRNKVGVAKTKLDFIWIHSSDRTKH